MFESEGEDVKLNCWELALDRQSVTINFVWFRCALAVKIFLLTMLLESKEREFPFKSFTSHLSLTGFSPTQSSETNSRGRGGRVWGKLVQGLPCIKNSFLYTIVIVMSMFFSKSTEMEGGRLEPFWNEYCNRMHCIRRLEVALNSLIPNQRRSMNVTPRLY